MEKIKKKLKVNTDPIFRFSFSDKNYREKLPSGMYRNYINYHAEYYSNGALKLSIHSHNSGSTLTQALMLVPPENISLELNNYLKEFEKKSRRNNFYGQVFLEHATFEEILSSIRFNLPMKKNHLNGIDINSFNTNTSQSKYKIQLLQEIRDNPSVLMNKPPIELVYLISIIETAKWDPDKEKASEAQNLLSRHLIPSQQRRPLPSNETLRMARTILFRLAKHLSSFCNKQLSKYAKKYHFYKKDIINDVEIWRDYYNELIKWAKDNNEKRIIHISDNTLKKLILKPANLIDNLLMEYFHISLRTLKKRLS